MISITNDPIDLAKIMSSVQESSSGGTVLFSGSVRARNDSGPILGIHYEAYVTMAEAKMSEIEQDTRKKWCINNFIGIHRVGFLAVGETSVAMVVSADHRKEAFEACRYGIDAIKARVPIW